MTIHHSHKGFCEYCWGKAHLRSMNDTEKTQTEHYHNIIKEAHIETKPMKELRKLSCPDPSRLTDAILKLPESEERDIVAMEFKLYMEKVDGMLTDMSHNMNVMIEDASGIFSKIEQMQNLKDPF